MGSSTTSDKTINTSTDSAATALTSITGTDDSMDAEPDLPDPAPPPAILDEPASGSHNPNPPNTAPPHYHRAQNSCEIDSPAYTKPQSATDVIHSPRPGPGRFIFDVPMPDPKQNKMDKEKDSKKEHKRNKTHTQVSRETASTSIQIPFDPKLETPKSPKAAQSKYETHFKFEPEPVKRRGSEPRLKNRQKIEKQEYYKDEVAKLRRQLEGTEVFTTNRRRSSAHQHSVPPPSSRRQSTAAQVHVTANPLDSAATTIPAGRTTIVVQQPSLSLDYGGCSTILLRDGEEGGRRKSRVCSDHIQQLLDVTSQFTSEDLHEFDKRCHVPECEANHTLDKAPSVEEWQPEWSSWAMPEDVTQCQRWKPVDRACGAASFDNTTVLECEDFVYQFRSSIVPEFDLACQEWKRSLVGTFHNIGMLISLPIMGYVSDRYGRRAALIVSGVGAGVMGLVKSFVSSYSAYLLVELMETVLGASVYPSAFVLMLEWLGVRQRILASLVLGIPLSMGAVTLSLLDYLTGYWRLWARIAYPPSFLLLLYPWVLPESVRWLVTRGRLNEAVQVIKQAAKCNGVAIPEQALEKMLVSESEQLSQKGGEVPIIEDESLFRAFIKQDSLEQWADSLAECVSLREIELQLPAAIGLNDPEAYRKIWSNPYKYIAYGALRRRLCVCFVWWISAVFVFYGLAVRAHALAGSAHANYALVAAAELPALLANTLLLDRVGRRPLLTAAFLLTAVTLIAIPCLPETASSSLGTALYLAGKVGVTMSLNALYVYSAELFPTRARHRLLAACSTLGRLGAILAPLTPLLASIRWWVPTMLFGTLPLISAALTRLVPDTLHQRLPDSFADLEPASETTSVS